MIHLRLFGICCQRDNKTETHCQNQKADQCTLCVYLCYPTHSFGTHNNKSTHRMQVKLDNLENIFIINTDSGTFF